MSEQIFQARITAVSGQPVQRILLEIAPGPACAYSFEAGQYLQIIGPDNTLIPMSIASAPQRLPELELHYRSTPGLPEAALMDALLSEGESLNITSATGEVRSGAVGQPLLIIAGGSGAAQAFSCIEHRDSTTQAAPTTLLWCADHPEDVYATAALSRYASLALKICIDDKRTADNEGLTWLRVHADDYRDAYVLIAGSPGFVYAATDVLLEAGFKDSQLHADVYAYAPRS